SRPKHTIGAKHVPDGSMVFGGETIAHLYPSAAIVIHCVRGNVRISVGTAAFAIVGFEAADDAAALRDEIAQLATQPVARIWVGEVHRAACAFPPVHAQRRSGER